MSRSSFSRLSSRSFPCGCTPTHPFVNSLAVRQSSGPRRGPDTEDFVRPSRAAWPSQSGERSTTKVESKCHLRLALQARASSARKGRCNRLLRSAFLICAFQTVSGRPFCRARVEVRPTPFGRPAFATVDRPPRTARYASPGETPVPSADRFYERRPLSVSTASQCWGRSSMARR